MNRALVVGLLPAGAVAVIALTAGAGGLGHPITTPATKSYSAAGGGGQSRPPLSGSTHRVTPPSPCPTKTPVSTPSRAKSAPVKPPAQVPYQPAPAPVSPAAEPPVALVVAAVAPASSGIGSAQSISSPGPTPELALTGPSAVVDTAAVGGGLLAGGLALLGTIWVLGRRRRA